MLISIRTPGTRWRGKGKAGCEVQKIEINPSPLSHVLIIIPSSEHRYHKPAPPPPPTPSIPSSSSKMIVTTKQRRRVLSPNHHNPSFYSTFDLPKPSLYLASALSLANLCSTTAFG